MYANSQKNDKNYNRRSYSIHAEMKRGGRKYLRLNEYIKSVNFILLFILNFHAHSSCWIQCETKFLIVNHTFEFVIIISYFVSNVYYELFISEFYFLILVYFFCFQFYICMMRLLHDSPFSHVKRFILLFLFVFFFLETSLFEKLSP